MSSKIHPLLKAAPHKELLLGNDAYVRGMIEAGVKVATCYPGSPTSEIGVRLAEITEQSGIYFEFSTNEKVTTNPPGKVNKLSWTNESAATFSPTLFMKHVAGAPPIAAEAATSVATFSFVENSK
ncbi:MAG: hypothetical protein ACTSPT_03945 [Candidatus Heimdallarchaeota archaeon]